MTDDIEIMPVSVDDAGELLDIYRYYIANTAITFEYDDPGLAEFQNRIRNISKKYPYIKAVRNGETVGYAYTSAFKTRSAYDWAVETTVYVKKGFDKMGIGKALYTELERISLAQNITNMNACISYAEVEDEYLTNNSSRFHEHMGYKLAGRFHKCGYKFGRWYDMIWMEKIIAPHKDDPGALIAFPQL